VSQEVSSVHGISLVSARSGTRAIEEVAMMGAFDWVQRKPTVATSCRCVWPAALAPKAIFQISPLSVMPNGNVATPWQLPRMKANPKI
jgi:hypothetical protein